MQNDQNSYDENESEEYELEIITFELNKKDDNLRDNIQAMVRLSLTR
jgi:hypothetical protein